MSLPRPIFMIGWEFPPFYSGGLGVACHGLAKGLIQEGERLVFAVPTTTMSQGYRVSSYKFMPDVAMQMIYIKSSLKNPYAQIKRTRKPHLADAPSHNIFEETEQYGRMVAQAADKFPEQQLIHAHDWMSIPAGLQTRDRLRKPLVLQIHSTEFDRAGGGSPNPQIAEIEWQGLTQADKIVAVSEYTKQMIIDKYSIPADNIEVVHNGVDPNPEYHSQALPNFLSGRPVVVFVGRLTIQKGPEYFLAVAKKVIAQEPKAIFVLAGQGDLYQSLLVSAAAQQLSGSVLFAGFLRDKEKEMLYQRASVFVMPSVSEPFGISALEAAQAGTPVIVSKNAGVREVLPHAEAIDFWDIGAMTEAVLKSIRMSPAQRTVQTDIMQHEAQQQNWRGAAQQMQKLYKNLFS